jgi:hypothetical protein
MRSIMRFLVLGAVVFGGLLINGIQPVYADDELPAGVYQGIITLAFHSWTTALGGKENVTINWFAEGDLDLKITGEKYGTMTITYIPVDIFDNANIDVGGCNASTGIKANGSFLGGTAGLNFDPKQKVGTLYLLWGGLDGFDVGWDTAKGCKNKPSEAQKIAINQTSPKIGKITVTVTNIDDIFITGNCRLPDWEGSGSIPNGSYVHIIDSCNWWAMKLEAQEKGEMEWKNKCTAPIPISVAG